MVCVLVPLLLFFTSLSSSDTQPASPCRPRWLQLGQQCFAFFPVWSCWSAANSTCSLSGGTLASPRTSEERQVIRQLANTHTPVWLGGHPPPQGDSWFWSDNSSLSGGKRPSQGGARGGGACLEMTPESGELHSAPCDELRFYVCSTTASSSSSVVPGNRKPVEPGIVPGEGVLDVVWSYSDSLAEEILHSSSLIRELRSGHLTERCYTTFTQQEALYLHRVACTLKTLITGLQETSDTRSLLLDTVELYSNRNQSILPLPPPKWLPSSLRSFHSVVLEEPIYWLVALSARVALRNFLMQELVSSEHRLQFRPEADNFYGQWSRESMEEVAWIHRYNKVLEESRDRLHVFKAVNIFREHMINQKKLYKAITCDEEGGGS